MTATPHPRTYVAVIDDTPESRTALRFAARRAARTGGTVLLLAVAPAPEFSQWGGVQAAMEQEAQERAEGLLAHVAGEVLEEAGIRPSIRASVGDPVEAVKALLAEEISVDALVLGAAARGGPGPLVAYFTGEAAGTLRCPIMIIPGGLDDEALDRLS